ncbi:aromatic amino acid lyase [Nocardia asteroides]
MLEEWQTDPAVIRICGRLTPEILAKAEHPVSVRIADPALAQASRSRVLRDRQPGDLDMAGAGAVTDSSVEGSDRGRTAAGHPVDLPAKVVRAVALARLWPLARAGSGASVALLSTLSGMLGTPFAPAVPMPARGSSGADYDHIAVTHMARALRGNGHALVGAERVPAAEGLQAVGLAAAAIDERDEQLLVGGTPLTAVATALALASVRRSHTIAMRLTALVTDFLGYGVGFPAPEMLGLASHPQVATVILQMRALLATAAPTDIGAAPMPYALSCSPDLLGAASEAIRQADGVVDNDLNHVDHRRTRVPEQCVDHDRVPWQATPSAIELLDSGMAVLANLAQLQLDLLLDSRHTDSPLAEPALTPEQQHQLRPLKTLATPITAALRRAGGSAPGQRFPSAHEPDTNSCRFYSALDTLDLTASLHQLYAVLAAAVRHAVHISGRRPTSPASTTLIDQLTELIPPDSHRTPLVEMHKIANLLDMWGR